ncbi:efflux RND transporter periplasmic adaptor subunit [Candidatus Nomurabacteria bacterium]|nr:efflux RND transporter periplasmic adaptor subunit [Candidatus Nomurabacteria bacterium]
MKKISLWLGGTVILLLIVYVGMRSSSNGSPTYETTFATKNTVEQVVSVTGQVKPAQDASLAFEQGGKVTTLFVQVGDQVARDDLLATIDQADVLAQLSEAAARIQSDRANLSQLQAALATEEVLLLELQKGPRPEDVAISQTKVENAQKSMQDAQKKLETTQAKAETDLNNIYDDVQNVLRDVLNKTQDAVYTQTNAMIPDEDTSLPRATFESRDENSLRLAELYKLQLRGEIVDFALYIEDLEHDFEELSTSLKNATDLLQFVQAYLNSVDSALKKAQNLSVSSLETYKASVNSAKNSITTALTNINNKQQEILAQEASNALSVTSVQAELNSASYTLDVAKRELALKQAGSSQEEIEAQKARIKQAQANVASGNAKIAQSQANYQSIEAKLAKTQLISPIDGIVVKQDMELGEIVSAGTPMITIISKANYQIEANVPEVDIAKVKLDDKGEVDLDAYGSDEIFEVKVVAIDPAETIVDGVPTYKVTFEFVENDAKIKSGMTANIDLLAARKEDVVSLPGRTILRKNGSQFVRVLKTNGQGETQVVEQEVQTGLRGTGGNTEILSGVNEGDEIVVYVEQ